MFTSMHSGAVASGCRQAVYGSQRRLCFAAGQQSKAALARPVETSYIQLRQIPLSLKLGRRGSFAVSAAAASSEKSTEESKKQEYEAVIGIETHVQLSTRTKAYCSCANQYGDSPNTNICPVCLGQPGALPVLNKEMVRKAVAAGLALGSDIAPSSKFDRKQYFYADLPKGYQISQYDEPICTGGKVSIQLPDKKKPTTIGVTRAHIEEDAGKLNHSGASALSGSDYSLVDYNRAGVPLLEVVSEPDMRTGAEAAEYGAELQRIMRTIGVSNGNMQEGSMRCDVNISIRPKGREEFGTKVEIKNMNSFSAMQKAIEFETERQTELLEAGRADEIVQETRLWDENKLCTYSMRKKEGLADYRYFPEPDLPPAEVSEHMLEEIRAALPELPEARRNRYIGYGLPKADALLLADDHVVAGYFDAAMEAGSKAKPAANWIMGDIMAYCKNEKVAMDDLKLRPGTLAEMIKLIDDGTISGKIGKDLLPDLLEGKVEGALRDYVEEKGMVQISDPEVIGKWIAEVIEANPDQLAQFRGGKKKLQGYFVGQLMKVSKGQGNPGIMNKMLNEALNAE